MTKKTIVRIGFAVSLGKMNSFEKSSEDILSSPHQFKNSENDWPNWNTEQGSDESWPKWNK